MPLLVDTSVWSLAFRRDAPPDVPEVQFLARALGGGADDVFTAGVVVLELLRGFQPTRVAARLAERFAVMELMEPTRQDCIAAAELANTCARAGVQLGTIDALIAQLTIAHDLTLLTTDRDFVHVAHHVPLRVWRP